MSDQAEAKLRAVEAFIADMERRAHIRSSRYVRCKDVADALRYALEGDHMSAARDDKRRCPICDTRQFDKALAELRMWLADRAIERDRARRDAA